MVSSSLDVNKQQWSAAITVVSCRHISFINGVTTEGDMHALPSHTQAGKVYLAWSSGCSFVGKNALGENHVGKTPSKMI